MSVQFTLIQGVVVITIILILIVLLFNALKWLLINPGGPLELIQFIYLFGIAFRNKQWRNMLQLFGIIILLLSHQ